MITEQCHTTAQFDDYFTSVQSTRRALNARCATRLSRCDGKVACNVSNIHKHLVFTERLFSAASELYNDAHQSVTRQSRNAAITVTRTHGLRHFMALQIKFQL